MIGGAASGARNGSPATTTSASASRAPPRPATWCGQLHRRQHGGRRRGRQRDRRHHRSDQCHGQHDRRLGSRRGNVISGNIGAGIFADFREREHDSGQPDRPQRGGHSSAGQPAMASVSPPCRAPSSVEPPRALATCSPGTVPTESTTRRARRARSFSATVSVRTPLIRSGFRTASWVVRGWNRHEIGGTPRAR